MSGEERDDRGPEKPRPHDEPRPAGPVAGEGSSPWPGASAGEEPSPTPPAGGESAEDDQESGSQPRSPDAAEEVEHDLDALLAERDEYLELAKRTKADFENFRKRMAGDVQGAAARGKAEMVREVVPVLDDLERAIEAAGLDPEGEASDGLAHGVLLVFRSLRDVLARNGVEPVDPAGEKFDPNLHEALSTQPSDGAEPGTVLDVMQKGYRLGDQLVRPARVVVAE